MHGQIYHYDVLIRETHLDTFGHVNNAKYLQIFEEARWDFITANGYGLTEINETNLGPVILEVTVRFRRELLLRETARVESSVTAYRGRVGMIHQKIFGQDGRLCAEADFKFGLFDLVRRKLVPATPEWFRAVGVEPRAPLSKL